MLSIRRRQWHRPSTGGECHDLAGGACKRRRVWPIVCACEGVRGSIAETMTRQQSLWLAEHTTERSAGLMRGSTPRRTVNSARSTADPSNRHVCYWPPCAIPLVVPFATLAPTRRGGQQGGSEEWTWDATVRRWAGMMIQCETTFHGMAGTVGVTTAAASTWLTDSRPTRMAPKCSRREGELGGFPRGCTDDAGEVARPAATDKRRSWMVQRLSDTANTTAKARQGACVPASAAMEIAMGGGSRCKESRFVGDCATHSRPRLRRRWLSDGY